MPYEEELVRIKVKDALREAKANYPLARWRADQPPPPGLREKIALWIAPVVKWITQRLIAHSKLSTKLPPTDDPVQLARE